MQIILYNMSVTIQQEAPDTTLTSLPQSKGWCQMSSKDAWKDFTKNTTPFLKLPRELHMKIFENLNPIDATCLSLVKFVI